MSDIDTTPDLPRPPQCEIDAALADIPRLLFTRLSDGVLPISDSDQYFIQDRVIHEILCDAGHNPAAVLWAVHEALNRGFLEYQRWPGKNFHALVTCPALWEWYRHPGDADPTGAAPPNDNAVHSDDFRSVRWFGESYEFTTMQAACIDVLWRNWEQGTPVVSEAAILESAGSAGDRLRDVFDKDKHPACGTMIVQAGKGAFRLAETEKS